tara:strand:- start:16505 stop:17641 length:1137 start_codon:yes stop_codon:yes gene_type:complete
MHLQKLALLLLIFFLSCFDEGKKETNKSSLIVENSGYGEFQNNENPPVKFELIKSIDLSFNDDLIISRISAFTVDDRGNMYFVDSQQGKMVSLNPNGELRFVTGQKGRGPGDFENVYSMAYHDGFIYLTNLSGARIDAFDLQGNFISSTTLSKGINFGSIKGITDEGTFIMRSVVWGALADDILTVELTDDSVHVLNKFRFYYANEVEVNQSVSSSAGALLHEGTLIAGHLTDYTLNIYALNGDLVKSIRRDFEKILPPGIAESNGGVMIMGMGGLDPVGVLSNGYIITKVQWPTNIKDSNEYAKNRMNGNDVANLEYANSLDIFDSSGKLLYSYENQGGTTVIGNIQHIDNNDFVYSLTEDGSSLQKFKAIFKSQEY